jgi:hypothetical protein
MAPRPVSLIQIPVGSEASAAFADATGVRLKTAIADTATVIPRMTRSFVVIRCDLRMLDGTF